MKNKTNFKEAENLMKKLEQQGFKIQPNEVRKIGIKYDYDVNLKGKRVITILPRSKCLFKYTGIISSGKLITTKNKTDIDALYASLLEFKKEIVKRD